MLGKKTNKGFSLIEVLISFVILVLGILGAMTLIMRSTQLNTSSYEVGQVASLANSFIAKVRANPQYLDEYKSDSGSASDAATCAGKDKSCSGEERAKADLYDFDQQLQRIGLPNSTHEIVMTKDAMGSTDNKQYKLTISWGSSSNPSKYSTLFVVRQEKP